MTQPEMFNPYPRGSDLHAATERVIEAVRAFAPGHERAAQWVRLFYILEENGKQDWAKPDEPR